MDEFDKADAAQRLELHKETMKTGRNKPPPKSRNKLVHIALEGDSQSLRKLQTHRVTSSLLRKLFGVEVDHLKDQFHTVCKHCPMHSILCGGGNDPNLVVTACLILSCLQCGRMNGLANANLRHTSTSLRKGR
jgi:hypothetical protein